MGSETDAIPIYYLHIGKTAGTQIKEIGSQITVADCGYEVIGMPHRDGLDRVPEEAAYFFSIREPIARFRSGFYSRKRKGQPRFNSPWSAAETRAFARFEHANDLAEALFSPGQAGCDAFFAMQSIAHVARQQSHWFLGQGDFLEQRPPLHIIRQENFEDDLQVFLKKLGVTLNVKVTADPKLSHRNDYSDVVELSQRSRANLARWYVADIEFYHICSDWIERRT